MRHSHSKSTHNHEIYFAHGRSINLIYSDNSIKVREFSEDHGYGIRVLKEGKLGFAHCQKEEDIENTIINAAKLSIHSPRTGFSFPNHSLFPALNICDKQVASLDAAGLKDILLRIVNKASNKVEHCRVILSAAVSEVALKNSEGFGGSYKQTNLSLSVESMIDDGYGYAFYSGFATPAEPNELGADAADMAISMRNPKKVECGKYTIVLSPQALSSMLGILMQSFSGEWKRKGITKLADKLDKQIFFEGLSIYDDPTDTTGSSARPFDDEGVASVRRPLILKGRPVNFLYNLETAALEGVKKSGFCFRNDYSAAPSIGNSNLIFDAGDYSSFEEELHECILIHSMHGSHTSNPTTGDFGLEVSTAFHIKNGKKMPVRGFVLSGNVFNLFKNIIGLEKKVRVFGYLISPYIAFDMVRVVS